MSVRDATPHLRRIPDGLHQPPSKRSAACPSARRALNRLRILQRFPSSLVLVCFAALPWLACSSTNSVRDGQQASTKCASNDECVVGKEGCDVPKGVCTPLAPGVELGDGTLASVTLTEIYTAPAKAAPAKGPSFTDLAFSGDDKTQLWVIGYGDDTVHLGTGVGDTPGTWKEYRDPAALHFMHKPPAIAWGSEGLWGICGDNDNAQNDPRGAGEPNFFMGPAMFTSDLKIFTTQNVQTQLGSHYDMLHNTTFCRGIAHEQANIFWVFNGQLGSIEKYNFNKPHEPGGDDHSDGEIYRYALGQVKGVDGIPSHVAFDPADNFLYIADTGNKRIVKLDTTTGTLGARLPLRNEPLKANGVMEGTNVVEVVAPGFLTQPSGLEIRNGHIYVSDTATSTFYVFDKAGNEVRRLETGLPGKSLAGFTFGRDNKLWFVDRNQNRVVRVDPAPSVR
jgi:hypothetical protein